MRVMKAAKANKVYSIDETQKKSYIDQGYDIQDDAGNLIAYGRGKTVPYAEYEALKAELEEMRSKKPAKREKKGVEGAEDPKTEDTAEGLEKEGE